MSKITGNEPAMPRAKQVLGFGEDYQEIPGADGLTIRQYFAAMAMQGICAAINVHSSNFSPNEDTVKYITELSVMSADLLIAELNKETK